MHVFDEQTGTQLIPSGNRIVIPARATGAAPRAYQVRVFLNQVVSLRPIATVPTYGEYTQGVFTYTGTPSTQSLRHCTNVVRNHVTNTETCRAWTRYEHIVALDTATLTIDPVTVDLQTANRGTTTLRRPAYVQADMFTGPTITWNGGNDDLPGPF